MRTLTLIFTIISAIAICRAQEVQQTGTALTAEKAFADAPDDVITLVSKSGRLDMLDYYNAGSDKPTASVLGNKCVIKEIKNSADSVRSSLSYVSDDGLANTLIVLNGNDPNPIIAIIQTSEDPISESWIKFYDKKWQPLSRPVFTEPVLADWLKSPADRQEVAEALPFILAQYAFDTDTGELTLTHSMANYFVKGEGDVALSKIKPQIVYRWDGKLFKPVKRK